MVQDLDLTYFLFTIVSEMCVGGGMEDWFQEGAAVL